MDFKWNPALLVELKKTSFLLWSCHISNALPHIKLRGMIVRNNMMKDDSLSLNAYGVFSFHSTGGSSAWQFEGRLNAEELDELFFEPTIVRRTPTWLDLSVVTTDGKKIVTLPELTRSNVTRPRKCATYGAMTWMKMTFTAPKLVKALTAWANAKVGATVRGARPQQQTSKVHFCRAW